MSLRRCHKQSSKMSFMPRISLALSMASPALTAVSAFVPSGVHSSFANPKTWAAFNSRRSMRHQLSASSSKGGWSAADDWSLLSSESELIDTTDIFNVDISGEAAKKMEAEAEAKAAAADFAAAAGTATSAAATDVMEDPDDALVADAVEAIQNSITDPSDPPLYDSESSLEAYASTENAAEQAAKEIGLLVHCNESPQNMLVSEGRVVPPLTDEERYDVHQLVRVFKKDDATNGGEARYETTNFFDLAVLQIFREHATSNDDDEAILDGFGVASWLTKSLGDETDIPVGRHSKEVINIMARYGTYGTNAVTENEFHRLYLDAVVNAIRAQERKAPINRVDTMKMIVPTVDSIWRDFRNHGILPPVEEERIRMQVELDAKFSTNPIAADTIFDECEILEWGKTDHSNPRSYFDINDGNEDDGSAASSIRKSSHEMVELASDRKTPKRIRDGGFVFIDEESCIGCTQCATVAPSAFVMLDNGRARTYQQRSSPEIEAAVSSCPVSCMHYVGYKELKMYESARDHGDGRGDHRHFGGRNTHVPLYVAGIDSDANRKSSWYHYLRQKCYTSKNSCPQQGCYDCPNYSAPGQNPYFQARHRKAERARAKDLMESGEANLWRKTVEL